MTGSGLLLFGHTVGLDTVVAAGISTVVTGIVLFRIGARTRDRVKGARVSA